MTFCALSERAAVLLLAVLLGASVWLGADTQARAAFFGWVRDVYETHIVYRFTGEKSSEFLPYYTLGWLPEDYREVSADRNGDTMNILYVDANNSEEGLIFSYYRMHSGMLLELVEPMGEGREITVHGLSGYFHHAVKDGSTNELIWVDEERKIVFSLSAFLSEDDMLHIAESAFLEEITN